ncbi:type IV pilus assembly protein PilM [Dechloromonas sp. TW-R-39-2]|uniref:pilus assembly protein PilM n=2 Tax=Dechloromonas TaxID=73029 RepID=UPI00193E02BD|nr:MULTISPECIES: pilus assembly protein PilM [Dechloromonas]QRM18482.1 type IV pilus assembly protein PilM [Dechloromonas sp. TW-R-39-2]UCV11910.1 pilus assembly protein PilM [Dechloromonas denitrificans]
MGFDISTLLNPKARSLLGLDISSSAVKMVELASNGKKDGYRVERYTIEVLPKDAVLDGNIANLDAVVDSVRRAWKRLGTSTRNVAMALPSSAVISKKIIVPAGLRDEELEAQVELEANQYIPFSIDEVNLDYQVLGPAPSAPEELEVLIAASKKERVEDRVAVADAAGLKAVVLDVDTLAALSAFELIEQQLPAAGKNQVIALIDAGAHVMNLTVLRNGQQVYAREQAFGGAQLTSDIVRHYGMTHEDAEAAKRAGKLPEGYEAELLNPFMEGLALEVSRALQFFFTSTQYNQVDHIVLAGGCAVIPGIDEVVATRTQVNTLLANPFANMSISDRVRAKSLLVDSSSLMVACGLALRRFDPS